MRKSKLLKNRASFLADTESIKVVAQNVTSIRIGLQLVGTGTTAITLANLIAHLANIKLTVGGEIETLIRGDDLFALNYILHDLMPDIVPQKPYYLLTTTADNTVGYLKEILPVGLTTDKEIYVNCAYTAVTDADGNTITLQADYGDKPYSSKPLAFRYITMNTATSFTEGDISVAGKKLVGLLIYSTTLTAAGSVWDASCAEIKLLVKREEKIHAHWLCLDHAEVDVEDTVITAILDSYVYMDLCNDPVPSDDLKAAIRSIAATDAVRLIGVYQ